MKKRCADNITKSHQYARLKKEKKKRTKTKQEESVSRARDREKARVQQEPVVPGPALLHTMAWRMEGTAGQAEIAPLSGTSGRAGCLCPLNIPLRSHTLSSWPGRHVFILR